jgi:hypothetical protein
MSKEVPLQTDMFTKKLVDTRSRKQRQRARKQEQPWQAEMFSQRELAQFGVNPRPKLPISAKTRIELMIEDHRTEEEKAEAIQQQAMKRNYRLFDEGTQEM